MTSRVRNVGEGDVIIIAVRLSHQGGKKDEEQPWDQSSSRGDGANVCCGGLKGWFARRSGEGCNPRRSRASTDGEVEKKKRRARRGEESAVSTRKTVQGRRNHLLSLYL